MIPSVQFDNQFAAYTDKVGNVVSYDMLALECDSYPVGFQVVP